MVSAVATFRLIVPSAVEASTLVTFAPSDMVVSAGDKGKKGDLIGYVGSTGRSTGPHLHYEVRIDGRAVNPVPYMVESEAQRAFALATGTGGQGDGDDN